MSQPDSIYAPDTLRTVFLDRNGVVNRKAPEGEYVYRWEDFHLLPSVSQAIARLNRAGVTALVVSNQRGIAMGLYTPQDVAAIHDHLQRELARFDAHIDGFYVCPHDRQDCNCRKPRPGLYAQAAAEFADIRASTSVMIGDSLSDIEFGRNLGMFTIFLENESETRTEEAAAARALADLRFPSLAKAVETLLADPRAQPNSDNCSDARPARSHNRGSAIQMRSVPTL